MDGSPIALAPIDILGLVLIGVLLLLGLIRGLWWQVIRLIGVTLSVVAARAAGATLSARLTTLFPDLQVRTANGIAWGLLFLTTLLACALLGMLGQRMLEAMKLGFANRLAGAFAGAVTGLCLHVVAIVLLCQLAPGPLLGKHFLGTYSERLYSALGVRWPVVMARDASAQVQQVLDQQPAHVRAPTESTVR